MADFSAKFYANFIKDDRWLGLVSGLKVTIIVTLEALLLGVIIGFIVAIIRSYHDKTNKLKILNAICKVYDDDPDLDHVSGCVRLFFTGFHYHRWYCLWY